jgi:uncharacterized protein (TIGR00369 family)
MTHPEPGKAMVARVQASVERQGMMATLGVEVIAIERGRVEMALRYDDRFTQQDGFLHAGAVASVLDSACGYAAYTVMPPDASVLTVTYTINLLAPAAGQRFTMTGQVLRAGRTLIVCRGQAFADGADRPFAAMQATMTAVRERPGPSG